MRSAFYGVLLLIAAWCLPAQAQAQASLTGLTVAPDHIRGGNTARATVTLSGPAPAGGTVVTVFSLHPSVILVGDPTPSMVTIAAGASTAQFDVAALPVDTTVRTFLGATLLNQTLTDS